ncbi:MAG: hypothetical protein Kow00127_22250 [Bacteroidales bacterium]
MKWLQHPLARNKYFITLVIFAIWMLFFDSNSLWHQYRAITTLNNLRSEKEYYQQAIEEDSAIIREILIDEEALERYGREHYLMKRDNEDIFLIIKD